MTTFLIIIGILILIFIALKLIKVKPKEKPKSKINQNNENLFPPEIMEMYNSMFENGTDQDVMPNGYGEFGHVATNPIPVNTVAGGVLYLSKLRTLTGEKIEYSRVFSVSAPNIDKPIDMYSILVDGREISELFICPYNKKNSEKAPSGFKFNGVNDQSDIGVILAKQANIETFFEEGKIGGFIILTKGDINSLISKFKNSEIKTAFIGEIEERIKNKNYKVDFPKVLEDYLPNSIKVEVAAKTTKTVLTTNYEPIFGWE